MRKMLMAMFTSLVLLMPSRASAVQIGYELSGTVTGTFEGLPDYMPGIDVGTPLTAVLVYETDPFLRDLLSSFDMDVGAFHFSGLVSYGTASALAGNLTWSGLDILRVTGPFAQPLRSDWLQLSFGVNSGGTLFYHGLTGCLCADDSPGFTASLDSVTLVPDVGGTFALLALSTSGLIALHQAARRRRFAVCRQPTR